MLQALFPQAPLLRCWESGATGLLRVATLPDPLKRMVSTTVSTRVSTRQSAESSGNGSQRCAGCPTCLPPETTVIQEPGSGAGSAEIYVISDGTMKGYHLRLSVRRGGRRA